MKLLNEAYGVLSSPVSRKEYDRKLAQEKAEPAKQTTNTKNHQEKPPENTVNPFSTYRPSKFNNEKALAKAKRLNTILALIKPVLGLSFILIAVVGYFISIDESNLIDNQIETTFTHTPQTSTTAAQPSHYFGMQEKQTPHFEPETGYIFEGKEYYTSEITIKANASESVVVKLKDTQGNTVISFFVQAGDRISMGVPGQNLYVMFASGDTWYGYEDLFGDGNKTHYSKDDDLVNFADYTWEYELQPVTDGNFSDTPISEEEFKS